MEQTSLSEYSKVMAFFLEVYNQMKILLSIYCLAKLYIAATQCYSQLVIVYTVQLIYEVRSGAGTIQLLTLKPEELNKEITKKFEVLGIEIPNMKYVTYRIVQT